MTNIERKQTGIVRDFVADRAIIEAATAGNWFVMHDTDICVENPPGSCEIDSVAWSMGRHDSKFIAAARDGWPAALDEIEHLERIISVLSNGPSKTALMFRNVGLEQKSEFNDALIKAQAAENERLRTRLNEALGEIERMRAELANLYMLVTSMCASKGDMIQRMKTHAREVLTHAEAAEN